MDKCKCFHKNKSHIQDDPSGLTEQQQRPIVIAKRNDERFRHLLEATPTVNLVTKPQNIKEKQLTILTKPKVEMDDDNQLPSASHLIPIKTMIITRSDANLNSSNAIDLNKTVEQQQQQQQHQEHQQKEQIQQNVTSSVQLNEPVPLMSHSESLISFNGTLNLAAKNLFDSKNKDFLVIGVIGTQGVGKSTILNLLAHDDIESEDFYQKIFIREDCIFPTTLNKEKYMTRSRTISTNFYIKSERIILLDSPPVLCNSYKKDAITNETEDLRSIINFLSVCHLVIVVHDEYFNLSFLRLLELAVMMKIPEPSIDNKCLVDNYYPNFVFVKNLAKHIDYLPIRMKRFEKIINVFFKNETASHFEQSQSSQQPQERNEGEVEGPITKMEQLHISMMTSSKTPKFPRSEVKIKTFRLPNFQNANATVFHDSLPEIVNELRLLVFTSQRKKILSDINFTESKWFDFLSSVIQNPHNDLLKSYIDIQQRRFDDLGNNNDSIKNSRKSELEDYNKDENKNQS